MSHVLVTGGAGYIGAHLCKLLFQNGFTPVVFDNLTTGKKERVHWGILETGTMCEKKHLIALFEKYDIKAVFHLAALTFPEDSIKHPDKYYDTNLVASIYLLEVMQQFDVKQFIFSSSASVYGLANQPVLDEDDPTLPVSAYGKTKLMVENIMEDFSEAYGLRGVALRCFNVAGASFDADIGYNRHKPSYLIPRLLDVALENIPEIEIYGTDHATEDGSPIRDYVHVLDVAEAHLSALRYCEKESGVLVCNIGAGRGISVREVIQVVEKITQKPIAVKEMSRREKDPSISVADIKTAIKTLKWKPQFSDIETIIKSALAWHQKKTIIQK